ncbi:aminopeptidase P family protein [Halotalea alkalilenta]|uniref:Peptidase M24 n=1 Tax=Halotalea alkalilenta TaxID=376489 RepID=A0A172YAK3_9GAMM|nr:aminopeptidase P family protein [Halotalea alkalilenta]ANF56244.1 peptidase M24 [Halotalea alkalilenta]
MPAETVQTIANRIDMLRQALEREGLDAWIAPSSDPHLSEYLPAHFSNREWLSGFTGSAGTLVVLGDDATLWADSRYWVQAEQQLDGSGIQLERLIPAEGRDHIAWLVSTLAEGARVGVDGAVLSLAAARTLEAAFAAKGIELATDRDLVGAIWPDRPALPKAPVYAHLDEFATTKRAVKLTALRRALEARGAQWQLLSSLDDVAWLFNLRGSDVDYNPVFLAHALIGPEQATLFVDETKFDAALIDELAADGVNLAPYDSVLEALAQLPSQARVSLDPNRLSLRLHQALPEGAATIEGISPTTLAKACKSEADLVHVRHAMEEDGAALCEFFAWLEAALARGEAITELTIDERLSARRAKRSRFVSLSFPTIAGFNANGALPHYRATETAHARISGNGLLLIDSGAQYLDGTTDITRVVPIGTPSDAQRRDYTLVLKGTIALSRARFPEGLKAPLLDAIARAPLWAAGVDFGHGTGHGVGYFMNVHEGPQVISYHAQPAPQTAMRAGMITSIEPGLYRPGQWGIRIENLVANQPFIEADGEFGEFLHFETLTLCPIDTRPIDLALLTQEEIAWLDAYHVEVRARLAPKLEGEALAWLELRTAPLAG